MTPGAHAVGRCMKLTNQAEISLHEVLNAKHVGLLDILKDHGLPVTRCSVFNDDLKVDWSKVSLLTETFDVKMNVWRFKWELK